jgi:UDP-glucuronate 4-epimerase
LKYSVIRHAAQYGSSVPHCKAESAGHVDLASSIAPRPPRSAGSTFSPALLYSLPVNFLVTGGAGFIGSHVCERLLRSGHAVWAFDDLNDFYDPQIKRKNLHDIQSLGGRFQFVAGDVTDGPALDELFTSVKFDQAIHLAARAGVRPSLQQPALYQRVNVEGTVNLLEAARLSRVKKVIIASSSSVYGVNSKVPFSEKDPIFSAISPYAASKLATEALGHVYHHVYGLDIVMLRFFTVYGPRQRPDLAIHKFARLIHADKPLPVFGDGSAARDHTYISDILDGVIACTQREFGYEIFNLGESQTVRLDRLIALLEKALGKAAIVDRQPLQAGDVPITFADISKARTKLGYQPRVKIDQGIPLFVDWFNRNTV